MLFGSLFELDHLRIRLLIFLEMFLSPIPIDCFFDLLFLLPDKYQKKKVAICDSLTNEQFNKRSEI